MVPSRVARWSPSLVGQACGRGQLPGGRRASLRSSRASGIQPRTVRRGRRAAPARQTFDGCRHRWRAVRCPGDVAITAEPDGHPCPHPRCGVCASAGPLRWWLACSRWPCSRWAGRTPGHPALLGGGGVFAVYAVAAAGCPVGGAASAARRRPVAGRLARAWVVLLALTPDASGWPSRCSSSSCTCCPAASGSPSRAATVAAVAGFGLAPAHLHAGHGARAAPWAPRSPSRSSSGTRPCTGRANSAAD